MSTTSRTVDRSAVSVSSAIRRPEGPASATTSVARVRSTMSAAWTPVQSALTVTSVPPA